MGTGTSMGMLAVLLSGCSGGGGGQVESARSVPASVSASAPTSTPPPVTESSAVATATTAVETEVSSPPPSSADTPVSEPTGAAALWGREYSGRADVSVDVYDYCGSGGSRRLADSKTYSMNATLNLARPRTGGGETEDNPFSLLLAVGQPSEAGAVSFWSSAVSTVSSQDLAGNPRDPNLLLTYWHLEWTDGELSGRLTDPHTEQAVTLNLVNWPSLIVACRPDLGALPGGYPHAVAAGTTLRGKLDGDSASLTAQGGSGDSLLKFRFDFTGTSS
ncbi:MULTISPECIES: hypothetical protein [unclassified Streptomyces]|uniref:hypothetical protein n=1 Tax=unclassified Streptomyces TaxID=2593676 RepID=UPI003D92EDBD